MRVEDWASWILGRWTDRSLAAAWIDAPDWATGWRRYAEVDAVTNGEASAEASAEVRETNIQTLQLIATGRRRGCL